MSLRERVFGIETEYAINFYPVGQSQAPEPRMIVQSLQEILAKDYGLPDSEFLVTGGKFHHDVGHAEWAGPECLTAHEAAIYDKAADSLLAQTLPQAQQLLDAKGYTGKLLIAKNNVDTQGNTYGCHENYLMLRNTELLVHDQFLRYLSRCLVPFLVTRQIFAGAGQFIAPTRSDNAPSSPHPTYELAQRSAFIDTLISADTTKERPIINMGRESETLASGNYRRLHLILGDANMSGWATWMKLGTMGILLRMIEDMFLLDTPLLQYPVAAIHAVSRDLTCNAPLLLRQGKQMGALDIQWHYLELADSYLAQFESSPEEDAIMDAWHLALTDIEEDVSRLRNRSDWVLKKRLLDTYLTQADASWEQMSDTVADSLQARNLLYHDISPDGLFNRFCSPDTLVTAEEIQRAQRVAPQYTRARVRGEFIQYARHRKQRVSVERWQHVTINGKKIPLPDPLAFATTELEFDRDWWTNNITHDNPHIRVRAIQLLTWQKHPVSSSLLISRAQNDTSELVRSAAVEALGHRADRTAKDTLIACLGDASYRVRWAAEEALERVNQGVPTLPPTVAPGESDEADSLIQIIS